MNNKSLFIVTPPIKVSRWLIDTVFNFWTDQTLYFYVLSDKYRYINYAFEISLYILYYAILNNGLLYVWFDYRFLPSSDPVW
jgi:hypothetical protein